MNLRGTWIVCITDVPGAQDQYLGPFASEEKAHKIAERLRRDFEAVGADSTVIDAMVEWVQPGASFDELRDELLEDLEKQGYCYSPAPSEPA